MRGRPRKDNRAIQLLMKLNAAGKSVKEIARELNMADGSVRSYIRIRGGIIPQKIATIASLKKCCERAQMSQKQFALRLGISVRVWESWMYERGIPSSIARLVFLAAEHIVQSRRPLLWRREKRKR